MNAHQAASPARHLDVELLDGLPAVHVATGAHSHNVAKVVELLVRDGAKVLPIRRLVERELRQLAQRQRLARRGVRLVRPNPGHQRNQIEP